MSRGRSLHAAVVCSGNICRSPMAEHVWRKHVPGVRFTSAGVRPLDPGGPADPDAVAILKRRGYGSEHRVCGVSVQTLSADLILVADPRMSELLVALGASPAAIRPVCSFDPLSADSETVANPWGESHECYRAVLGLLERCVPQLQAWVEERQ